MRKLSHKYQVSDFRQAPYLMTGSGIGSGLRIVEVGGIGNIYPVIKCDKFFDLKVFLNRIR